MKKINKTVVFSLVIFILSFAITQVTANRTHFFQAPTNSFRARVLDEHGKEMEGAIGRIKGREDEKVKGYDTRTSGKDKLISFYNYPTNAIIVISKPGYITQEISTKGLPQPKVKWNPEDIRKCIITVKMVSLKKGNKQPMAKKIKK